MWVHHTLHATAASKLHQTKRERRLAASLHFPFLPLKAWSPCAFASRPTVLKRMSVSCEIHLNVHCLAIIWVIAIYEGDRAQKEWQRFSAEFVGAVIVSINFQNIFFFVAVVVIARLSAINTHESSTAAIRRILCSFWLFYSARFPFVCNIAISHMIQFHVPVCVCVCTAKHDMNSLMYGINIFLNKLWEADIPRRDRTNKKERRETNRKCSCSENIQMEKKNCGHERRRPSRNATNSTIISKSSGAINFCFFFILLYLYSFHRLPFVTRARCWEWICNEVEEKWLSFARSAASTPFHRVKIQMGEFEHLFGIFTACSALNYAENEKRNYSRARNKSAWAAINCSNLSSRIRHHRASSSHIDFHRTEAVSHLFTDFVQFQLSTDDRRYDGILLSPDTCLLETCLYYSVVGRWWCTIECLCV